MLPPLWNDICFKAGEMNVCKTITVLVYKAHSCLLIGVVFSVIYLLTETLALQRKYFAPEITIC